MLIPVVIVLLLLVSIMLLCTLLYRKGGIERVIAITLASSTVVFLVINSVAIELFNVLYNTSVPLWPWASLEAFLMAPPNSNFYHAWICCYSTTMLISLGLIIIAIVTKLKTPNEKIFGDAHFASCDVSTVFRTNN